MLHPIDPKIDCVFKALLGTEANRRLLIHFLNAVLGADLPAPVAEVAILNPYNEREFLDDKLSVVDVKARDPQGRVFQVEVQLLVLPDLPARILYGWSDLYASQLASGEDYRELKPTYSIWLLGETLRAGLPEYRHCFRMRDEQGRALIDHGGIWLLELGKFAAGGMQAGRPDVATELERWLKFFSEGERLDADALPPWMQTEEMQQAMSTLIGFSEKEREYHAYQARQNYLRQQRSIQRRLEELETAETRAREAMAQACEVAEREHALAEHERAAAEHERAAAEHERAVADQERAAAKHERAVAEKERAEKEAALDREAAALSEIERLRRLLEEKPEAS
jgi:predicted transposase/invertase (TIGR01784 family)